VLRHVAQGDLRMTTLASGPASCVDLERYPVGALDSAVGQEFLVAQRHALAQRGVAILPGFVKADAVAAMAAEGIALRDQGHLQDVWGTPYLEVPDHSLPEDHPRRYLGRSLTHVIAYDLLPEDSLLRALYEWDPLMNFVGEILERRPLYRMTDPLGALNVAVMPDGHTQTWHYDNAEFVVSLALQASTAGGAFECASFIRNADDENYTEVARVLAEQAPHRVEVLPMVPGTLMIFCGRRSLHRVSPVLGPVPRVVALLAYDTRPESDTNELFKLMRYGRTEARVGVRSA